MLRTRGRLRAGMPFTFLKSTVVVLGRLPPALAANASEEKPAAGKGISKTLGCSGKRTGCLSGIHLVALVAVAICAMGLSAPQLPSALLSQETVPLPINSFTPSMILMTPDVFTATPSVLDNGFRLQVRTEWVRLETSVWDRREKKIILGLEKADFELLEDGQVQSVLTCLVGATPFHLVLLIDTSASTTPFIKTLRQAAVQFVKVISPADRVAIVTFNAGVVLLQPFTNDREKAIKAIRTITPGGNTALYDAVLASMRLLESVKGKKAIVLFSDGGENRLSNPNYGSKATFAVLHKALLKSECLVYPVLLTPPGPSASRRITFAQAQQELQRVADDSGARMYTARKSADLSETYSQIALDLRLIYTLAYQRQVGAPSRDWHELKVQVRNQPDFRIHARKGFFSGETAAE